MGPTCGPICYVHLTSVCIEIIYRWAPWEGVLVEGPIVRECLRRRHCLSGKLSVGMEHEGSVVRQRFFFAFIMLSELASGFFKEAKMFIRVKSRLMLQPKKIYPSLHVISLGQNFGPAHNPTNFTRILPNFYRNTSIFGGIERFFKTGSQNEDLFKT